MLYFTSDLHLGHNNVIRHTDRPFETVEAMNDALIANINNTVMPNDTLYILGDFSYRVTVEEAAALARRIRCRSLHLIKGNHDKHWEGGGIFKTVQDYLHFKHEGLKLTLFHYPIMDWSGARHNEEGLQSLHLHGHIHSRRPDLNLDNFSKRIFRYDVGVDANGYRPVSLEDILGMAQALQPPG